MKLTTGFGYASGLLLILSALAHAFTGWAPIRLALIGSEVDPGLIGALAAGWYFGSVAMLAFGLIVLVSARRAARRVPNPLGGVRTIALAYLAFGLAAFFLRNLNPHFLGFVVLGLMVGAYALLAARQT